MTSIAWLAEEFRKDKRVAKREETRRRWEDEAERRAERKCEDEAERLRDISGWIHLKWERTNLPPPLHSLGQTMIKQYPENG